MGISYSEVLRLPSVKDIKVVGGSNGFDRVIRWVYVGDCLENSCDIVNWLFGDELVIITGISIKRNNGTLFELVSKLIEKSAAGVIINVGPYIKNIPREVAKLADDFGLPLFELPWESKLVEITRDICSAIIIKELEEKTFVNLLENILFSRMDPPLEIKELAFRYGFDSKSDYTAGIIDIDSFASYLKGRNITDEREIIKIKAYLLRTVNEVFARHNLKLLSMSRSDSVIFLVKSNSHVQSTITNILDEIRKEIGSRFEGIKISAGIGNSHSGISNVRNSYRQAEQALKAARCELSENSTLFYDNIGIYMILLNMDDNHLLETYYSAVFGPIMEYDRSSGSNLLYTLEVYLHENCNMATTSEKLFIHKNTLKYRLQKIEDLLRCDLRDLQQLIKYEIGYKVGRLLNTVL